MNKNKHKLPKIIWFLWLQGFDEMPFLVKRCYDSWQAHHPDWRINFLDKNNIYDFVDLKEVLENRHSKIYRVSKSEIIRINLLRKYGGVWVDATCYCQQKLDHWLFDKLDAGYFVFHRPGFDRMLSSWFMAAVENNELVEVYASQVNKWWLANKNIKLWIDKPFIHKLILKSKLHGYLKKNPTLWYHPVFVKLLKIYPYFWFFYFFEKLYQENDKVKKVWEKMPKISADIPHKIQRFGLFNAITPEIQKEIDQRIDPLYKLTFKFEPDQMKPGCALDYLLNKNGLLA